MAMDQKTVQNLEFLELRRVLKKELNDLEKTDKEILDVLKDISRNMNTSKIKEEMGGEGFKKLIDRLKKKNDEKPGNEFKLGNLENFTKGFTDRLKEYKDFFTKKENIEIAAAEKPLNLLEKSDQETKTLQWQNDLLDEIKLLRKDLTTGRLVKPTKPTIPAIVPGFKEAPSGLMVPETVKTKGTSEPDIANMKKAMLGDGINVKIVNPEEIKTEISGGGGLGIPDVSIPPGKPNVPGPASKPSLGSRIGKFLGGTGGKLLGGAAALGLGAYTAYSEFTEAEEEKQKELKSIDEKVKQGEISAKEGEALKKEVSSVATENKGGAIGKGTGIAAGAIGGGVAGAKVGATIGTFLGGPVGTVLGAGIGTVAGGAIGAISGSSVGQNIGGAIGKGVSGIKRFFGVKEDTAAGADDTVKLESSKKSTQMEFSEEVFAKTDPENYEKFKEFRDKRTQEIAKDEAKKFNREKPSREDIKIAQKIAKDEAINKFKSEIEAAGAGKITTKTEKTSSAEPTKTISSEPISRSESMEGVGTALGAGVGTVAGGTTGTVSEPSLGQKIGDKISKGVSGIKRFFGIKEDKAIDAENKMKQEISKTSTPENKAIDADNTIKQESSKTSTQIEFREIDFAKNDPENYKKFSEFREKKQTELLQNKIEEHKRQYKKEPSRISMDLIKKEAALEAKIEAINKFKSEIEAAGAGKITTKTEKTSSAEPTKSTSSEPISRSEGMEGVRASLEKSSAAPVPISRSEGMEGVRASLEKSSAAPVPISRSEGMEGVRASIESSSKLDAEKTKAINTMSQENEELKRKSAAPIVAPPIISNNVQSTNTQTLAPIKAQPRGSISSALEKYLERTAVFS